jgi:succinate-semialdehyde dehydrogenase/glutarate-semialdehyde dehydrogenase
MIQSASARMMPTLLRERAWIDGVWLDADDGATLAVEDPSTSVAIGTVPAMGAAETDAAIAAAARAWPAWRELPAYDRGRLLREWAAQVIGAIDSLAAILHAEQGKPLAEARAEIASTAAFLDWFGEEARRARGDLIPANEADRRLFVLKRPIGVVAAITPWNFPSSMIARKAGAALAAGCTMVLKPSELTPFSALALGALAEKAGLPAGVLNIVTGPPEPIGAALTASAIVRKLSFTGSTRVGKLLAARCAATVKRVSLELGGNAALIVFDDADLDRAVVGAMTAKFRNAGQTCICANRIFVQAGIHDAFVERLAIAAPGAALGPLINRAAHDRVAGLVADAAADGARIVAPALSGGATVPILLLGVTDTMRVAREEIFGPIAPILRFDAEDEVIERANAVPHGLAAYVFTRSLERLFRISEALEVGMVGFNSGIVASEVGPFGGVKESGYGREGSHYGLDDYLETRQVMLAL